MFAVLFGIFLVVPLIEVSLFILVGGEIGIMPTVALCAASAVVGGLLVRHQGLQTLARLQDRLRAGEMPTDELVEGAAILAAGILLIVPGFFTDVIGFILLVPRMRRWTIAWLRDNFSIELYGFPPRARRDTPRADNNPQPEIIDIEAEEVFEEAPPRPSPRSTWRRD